MQANGSIRRLLCSIMSVNYWYVILIGGLIVWVGCMFLRTVAARACFLREQMELEEREKSEAARIAQAGDEDKSRAAAGHTRTVGSPPNTGGGDGDGDAIPVVSSSVQ